MEHPYHILGVSQAATPEEIRVAFRSLAKQYHPDLNPGDAKAERHFKQINEAYEMLKDPEKRKAYDQKQGAAKTGQTNRGTNQKSAPPPDKPFDFGNVHSSFADFLGLMQEPGKRERNKN